MRRFFPDYAPTLGRTTFQSLGVQVLQCASIWALLRATSAPGPPEAYQFVFLISSVVATIPFTIGGAGARELTFLAGAQYFGLPADAAVAVSLLFYGITALVSLTGAYYSWNDTTRQQTYRL